MFEFKNKVVNRDWYKFVAKENKDKFIYEAKNQKEIDVLKKYWFTEIKKTTKKES